jgi:hypothetical protein
MRDQRLGGIALISGALVGIVTMAFHPTGHDLSAPGRFESVAKLAVFVHMLAVASAPISFLGALALVQRLQAPDRLAVSALVVYGFGLFALIIAAAASGFVATSMARELAASSGAAKETWDVLLDSNHFVNQAFAKLFVVAASIAIVVWSIAIVKSRALGRAIGIYGIVLGPPTVVLLLSGHLRLDVHGMGAVVLTQSIWFVLVGASMCRGVANDGSS